MIEGPDISALAETCQRLGIGPRQMLVLAGRLAGSPGQPVDAARIAHELAGIAHGGVAVETVAALALLGYGAYSSDEVDRMLTFAWSGHHPAGAPCAAQR